MLLENSRLDFRVDRNFLSKNGAHMTLFSCFTEWLRIHGISLLAYQLLDFAFQELTLDQLQVKIGAVTREKEDALKDKTQILDEVSDLEKQWTAPPSPQGPQPLPPKSPLGLGGPTIGRAGDKTMKATAGQGRVQRDHSNAHEYTCFIPNGLRRLGDKLIIYANEIPYLFVPVGLMKIGAQTAMHHLAYTMLQCTILLNVTIFFCLLD